MRVVSEMMFQCKPWMQALTYFQCAASAMHGLCDSTHCPCTFFWTQFCTT